MSELPAVDGARARCEGVVRIYPSATGQVLALKGVDLELAPGALTVLVGPSGSGKSTLLALLGLRDRPTAGEVWWDDRPTTSLGRRELLEVRRRIRWVSQRPAESLFPHLSAGDHLRQTIRSTHVPDLDVDDALARVGLTSVRHTPTRYLSGGEQQRLAVVSAVIARAPVLLADEPTAELDDATSALVFTELSALARAGGTVVVATHDQRAQSFADRVVELQHGIASTEQDAAGTNFVSLDAHGRLLLPPDARAVLPGARARLAVNGSRVVLTPVEEA